MDRHLADCRAKLRRADELSTMLAKEIRGFFRQSGPAIEVLRDPQSGRGRVVISKLTKPPRRFNIIAGEVLHNLRSCLDQAVYQLIEFNTTRPPQYRTYEFPVYCTEKQFRDNVDRKLRDVSAAAVERIARVQPFNWERPRQTSLYVLNELNMLDKHRLVVSGVVLGRLRSLMASSDDTDVLIVNGEDFREVLLRNGSVLGTADRLVTPQTAAQAFMELDLVVRQPSPHIEHIGLVAMLGMLTRFVGHVLTHLHPAFQPSGTNRGRRAAHAQAANSEGRILL